MNHVEIEIVTEIVDGGAAEKEIEIDRLCHPTMKTEDAKTEEIGTTRTKKKNEKETERDRGL